VLRGGCSVVGLGLYLTRSTLRIHGSWPELTAPSGLYVYLWISGVNIKGDFFP